MIRDVLAVSLAVTLVMPLAVDVVSVPARASDRHDHSAMRHEMRESGEGARNHAPSEPGQSAFAAIQEIVEILDADPRTDWSRVDIPALRRHLIDINNVTLHAAVEAEPIGDGVRFTVTGEGRVQASIRRMVSAHAHMMNGRQGFRYEAETSPEGAVMTVHAIDPADREKLAGLGFIGVMTLGVHHQAHHLAIASGQSPH